MLNSAWTAAEMEQEIWTHQAPTQSRSPAHCNIRIGDIQYTLLDEIDNLTVKRCLKAVGNVSDDLFADMNRFLANRCIERNRALHDLRRSFLARHHLHQRDHVRRVEGMADDAPFGMLASRLHHAHGQPGRTRRDD